MHPMPLLSIFINPFLKNFEDRRNLRWEAPLLLL